MEPLTIRRLVIGALCTLLTSGFFQTEQRRDSWQKPDEVIRALDLKSGQVVVDIGAGDGYFTRRLARALAPQGKVIGLEIKSNLVEEMASDAKRLGLANYEARLVTTDDPKLEPASTDLIFLCDTYHHIASRVAYFKKVGQALRPGGRLVILDMVRTSRNTDHSIVKEEVVDELKQAGYRLVKEFDFLLPRQYFLVFEPVVVSTGGR
jgi:predicted methyltransferase